MIARLLLWSLDGSATTLDEVRARIDVLEPLPESSLWLGNEVSERFGIVVCTDEDDDVMPEQIAEIGALIGREPDVYEEFDLF